MIVVSDTTPLRHLIAIGQAELLSKLYGSVAIPPAVWNELQAEKTPAFVSTWLESTPEWLSIQAPRRPGPDDPAMESLDRGEREAIQLVIELDADLLLMDDRDGRCMALQLRLPVVGTLGVLERADSLGLLADFPATVADLEASGFYMSARLRDSILERHRLRH
jgi:predicted nucleic acid-binding protein